VTKKHISTVTVNLCFDDLYFNGRSKVCSWMMKLIFGNATASDAAALAALHSAVAGHLTRQFGAGRWSSAQTEKGVLNDLRKPKFSRILITRRGARIVAALRLATKKPWAIDTAYFSVATRPLYLTGMAVHPDIQRKGIGRRLLKEAESVARTWPADAIRLDAFDAEAGAGPFYVKCGFREIARVTYKGNPLVYFELALPSLIAEPKLVRHENSGRK
jgi:GNAT superfamily N-acetyltransferase